MSIDIQKENEELRLKAEALQKELEAMNAALNIAVPNKVAGTFTAKWETPMGDKKSRTFGFKEGYVNQWLNGYKVPTTDIIAMANGKKVPEIVSKTYPWLSQKFAAEYLTNLAMIDAGCLVDVK